MRYQAQIRRWTRRTSILASLALLALPTIGQGQTTYTWTGAADPADGDWNNPDNWDANGVPADDGASNGLTLPVGDQVIFSAATMPTVNVPGYGGAHDNTNGGAFSSPELVLNSGGTLTTSLTGGHAALWTNLASFDREVITVGDGTGPAGEVTLTFTNNAVRFGRHGNGSHTIRVNSDGVLNMQTVATQRWGYNGARPVYFLIDGGTVNLAGNIGGANYNDGAWEFLSLGGSLTFGKGGHYNTEADVLAHFGTKIITSAPDSLLEVVDNGTSFTVTSVQAPDPNYWTGTGGATWDQASTVNFTTNNEIDPLVEDTFANATAVSSRATFADAYFNAGNPVAVTQDNITTDGVSTGNIDFSNDTLAYTVTSSGFSGITGSSVVNVKGTGEVTLLGLHSYTGNTNIAEGGTLTVGDLTVATNTINASAGISNSGTLSLLNIATTYGNTITNSGALKLNTTADLSCPANITGSGTVEKLGSGTLTIPGDSAYNGLTTITEGTLKFTGQVQSDGITIQSGAVLELNHDTGGDRNYAANTYSGTGILRKTGANRVRWTNAVGTFALGSGALIDVQEGDFNAGSNANEDWTANLSDLHVASGASVSGTEANVRVDAVTGAGTITSGYDATAGYTNIAIGVDNGSGTFDGVIADTDTNIGRLAVLVKEGTGTQTFGGLNTYTGNTTVDDGVLTLADGGQLTFRPTAPGVTNVIQGTAGGTGSPVFNLDGSIYIDLANADATPLSSWLLVDETDLTVNYGATFNVNSSMGAFVEGDPGVWALEDGLYAWFFDQSTGTLSYGTSQNARIWTGSDSVNPGLWDAATTANFSNNAPADPLTVATFDVATATTMAAQFADEYFHDLGPTAVTQTSVSVGTGGVETGLIEFFNSTLDYTVESTDANGITGATAVRLRGGGPVTLLGTHAYTGETTIDVGNTLNLGDATKDGSIANSPVANNGVLVVTNAGALSHDAAISGAGALDKDGAGTLTLSTDTSYTGATTILDGDLILQGGTGSSSFDIGPATSSLTFDYDVAAGTLTFGTTSYTGSGTLRKAGAGTVRWQGAATFFLNSDALIDVQAGTFVGGAFNNDVWSGNLSDLNVAAGATFNGSEANVEVDVLTGAGSIWSGSDLETYFDFTFGADGGSGTFDGVLADNNADRGNFRKTGAGEQTLTGINTYTGNTSVDAGILTFAAGGALTFVPSTDDVNNYVFSGAGGGTVNLNGEIFLNLAGADTTAGNSWLLVDDFNMTVNYGATFSVNSSLGAFTNTAGVWTLDQDGLLWTFDQSTGELTVGPGTPPSGYNTWLALYPGLSDTGATADPELDGIANLLEYVLDGNPEASDPGILPTLDTSGADFVFSFTRREESANDTTQVFQYGSDLTGWTDLSITAPTAAEVTLGTPAGGLQTVTVTIPKSLAVDGRLFGRLNVTQLP